MPRAKPPVTPPPEDEQGRLLVEDEPARAVWVKTPFVWLFGRIGKVAIQPTPDGLYRYWFAPTYRAGVAQTLNEAKRLIQSYAREYNPVQFG